MARKHGKKPVQHEQLGTAGSLYRFLGSTDTFTYADERFRPTWEPPRGYRLTVEHRRQLCTHLAAHAVISSMGDAWVHMLAVAPVGVTTWTINDRKSSSLGKIFGICSTSDFYCSNLKWDDKRQIYVADRELWEHGLAYMYEGMTQRPVDSDLDPEAYDRFPEEAPTEELFIVSHRRVVRAQACGYLAGHIADGISAGMNADEALTLYDRRDTQYVGPSDLAVARGLTDLLPFGEYENVVQLTEEALRRPDIWDAVQRIAVQLEQFGLLEGDDCEGDIHSLLPPVETDWPHRLGRNPNS